MGNILLIISSFMYISYFIVGMCGIYMCVQLCVLFTQKHRPGKDIKRLSLLWLIEAIWEGLLTELRHQVSIKATKLLRSSYCF